MNSTLGPKANILGARLETPDRKIIYRTHAELSTPVKSVTERRLWRELEEELDPTFRPLQIEMIDRMNALEFGLEFGESWK